MEALTRADLDELIEWVTVNSSMWPTRIKGHFERLVAQHLELLKESKRASETLLAMKLAMGLIPSSERGSQILQKH